MDPIRQAKQTLANRVAHTQSGFWFAGILILALVVRLHGLVADGLWYDELLTVVRAYPSLRTTLVSMWEQSTHPPFYHLQMHLWLQLGTSDLWIRLNPLFWNLLSLISLYALARRVFSERVALLASLFVALSPLHVYYAQEARMYSLLFFFGIWAWFSTDRFFSSPNRPFLWAVLAGFACLFFLYSHGAGFLILAAVNSLAAWQGLQLKGRARRRLWLWLMAQGAVVLLSLPWLLHASERGVDHPLIPSLTDVLTTLNILLAGLMHADFLVGWLQFGPAALLLAASLLVLLRRQDRGLVFAFVAVPLVVCYALSHLVQPIWFFRTLAYTLPFMCLILALACAPTDQAGGAAPGTKTRLLSAVLTLSVLGMLGSGLIAHKTLFHKTWVVREAAAFVADEASAGDVVLVPNQRLFWVWSWYFVGPGSIDPLAQTDKVWAARPGVRVIWGTEASGSTIWLIYNRADGQDVLEGLLTSGWLQTGSWTFSGLTVTQLTQAASASAPAVGHLDGGPAP